MIYERRVVAVLAGYWVPWGSTQEVLDLLQHPETIACGMKEELDPPQSTALRIACPAPLGIARQPLAHVARTGGPSV